MLQDVSKLVGLFVSLLFCCVKVIRRRTLGLYMDERISATCRKKTTATNSFRTWKT